MSESARSLRLKFRTRIPLALLALGSLTGAIGLAAAQPSGAARGVNPGACFVPIAPGVTWPAAAWAKCVPGAIAQSSPAVATYDGKTILAVGDEAGFVHVVNAENGAELPGWPKKLYSRPGAKVAIEGSPTIAFLNGPKRAPTIVVGSASIWVGNTTHEVEAFTLRGRVKFIFHVGVQPGTAPGVFSTPAVGSLTGGRQQDIVFGSYDHYIYALGPNGKVLPGFPYNNADTIWSSPALYQLPGTKGDTIFIGSDASGITHCYGGFITAYRYIRQRPTIIWRHCENQTIWSSPAVGVINGTGRAAVIVGTGWYEQPFTSSTNKLFAYYADNGQPVPGWPVSLPGPAIGSPAIGAINSTGQPAVVETSWMCAGSTSNSCIGTNASEVTAWDGSGHQLWATHLRGATSFSSPILAPLSATDAWNDVLVGSPYGLYPLNGENGAYMFGTTSAVQHSAINFTCRVYNSAAVAELQNIGARSGWYVFEACGGPAAFGHDGEIVGYRMSFATTATSPAWPMFHADASHDGVVLP